MIDSDSDTDPDTDLDETLKPRNPETLKPETQESVSWLNDRFR
jgi:hypothetical protein